jgi:hypothetical protein
MPGRMQNDLPLSSALRVRVRLGGAVGVAEPQAAAAGGAVEGAAEGAVLPDGPPAAGPACCCPQAAARPDTPMTAAARSETLRMRTSQSQRVTAAVGSG